jgi:hypothetical protein
VSEDCQGAAKWRLETRNVRLSAERLTRHAYVTGDRRRNLDFLTEKDTLASVIFKSDSSRRNFNILSKEHDRIAEQRMDRSSAWKDILTILS